MSHGWDWLIENETLVRRFIARASSYPQTREDLWDVCVDRVNSIFDTWDPCKNASLTTHMIIGLRWYWHKHMTKRDLEVLVPELHEDVQPRIETKHFDDDEVQYLLEGLSTYEQEILMAVFVKGLSYRETADTYGLSVEPMYRHVQRAFAKMKENAKKHHEHGRRRGPEVR